MYFPVANIELNPLYPFLIGLVIAAISSPTGISGGFLIIPICINYLNFTSVAVSPSNYIFNITAMPAGLWRIAKEKRMLWKLGWVLSLASLPGIVAGMVLRNTYFREIKSFKIFVAFVLAILALNLARTLLKKEDSSVDKAEKSFIASQKKNKKPKDLKCNYSKGHLTFLFEGEEFFVSLRSLTFVSIIVGLIGGIYGIGGAAIIAPALVSFFRLPVYLINGASLLAGWASAIFGLFSYIFIWPLISGESAIWPDFKLGLLFGLGGALGAYAGSATQRFMPAKPLKIIMLALISIMIIQSLFKF